MAKELFANARAKVVPFEQDGQFYYKKARKYLENNNYINACEKCFDRKNRD